MCFPVVPLEWETLKEGHVCFPEWTTSEVAGCSTKSTSLAAYFQYHVEVGDKGD